MSDTWLGVRVTFEGGRDALYVYGDGVDAKSLTIVYEMGV